MAFGFSPIFLSVMVAYMVQTRTRFGIALSFSLLSSLAHPLLLQACAWKPDGFLWVLVFNCCCCFGSALVAFVAIAAIVEYPRRFFMLSCCGL